MKTGQLGRLGLCFWPAALAIFLCGAALAQEGDLAINMIVNYGSAYRDGEWTPVDVVVDNPKRDVDGWVELRTYGAGGELQNPIYRLRADSPRNSRKRFRFHCKLEKGAARIEARLYHGRRAFTDFPTFLNITPIRQEDFLCLVLDDKPENFGFLSTSLFRGSDDRRFYREALDTARLAYMADYPQCYDALDLIVMGEVDPGRIGLEHRDLLTRYVEKGGVLVVCAGANAKFYRGSWVEMLAGVSMGQEMIYKENDLARRVFNEAPFVDADDEEQALVTKLTPILDGVKTIGADPVLATLRPYGRGFIAVVAIDADSGALQKSEGFGGLWRDLIGRSSRPPRLNYAQAAQICANELPAVAGVTLLPVSSVIAYLVVYFAVAILGNWLFWNYFKRREYAWLCLIVFSVGFTGYAMVFGTAGRAKDSELEQIEVVCVPRPHDRTAPVAGEPRELEAELHAFAGLLASSSGRWGGSLVDEQSLVSGHTGFFYGGIPGRYGQSSAFESRPFLFVQDRPARIEDFQIGASEMRILQVDRRVKTAGGVRGTLTLDEHGELTGQLNNETGLNIQGAWVLCDGRVYQPKPQDGGWRFAQSEEPQGQPQSAEAALQAWRGRQAGGGPQMARRTQMAGRRIDNFRSSFAKQLLGEVDPTGMGNVWYNISLPPCLIGWAEGKDPYGSFAPDGRVKHNISGVLVVAEIDVERKMTGPRAVDVDVIYYGGGEMGQWCRPRWDPQHLLNPRQSLQNLANTPKGYLVEGTPMQAAVRLPATGLDTAMAPLRLDFVYPADMANAALATVHGMADPGYGQPFGGRPNAPTPVAQGELTLEVRAFDARGDEVVLTPAVDFLEGEGLRLRHDCYLLENWREIAPRGQNILNLSLVLASKDENIGDIESPWEPRARTRPGPGRPGARQVNSFFLMRASAVIEDDNEEGAPLWQ